LRQGLTAELRLFRHPKVALATLALIFVPSLYVLIYVGSVWDPYGNLSQLPAALVNQDAAILTAGREVNLGRDVVATLEKEKPFRFQPYATPEAAHQALTTGAVAFVLTIPPGFSRAAFVPGPAARLQLEIAEGANFTAAVFAQRFTSELTHSINERITQARWTSLVGDPADAKAADLAHGLQALKAGSRQLAEGGAALHAGLVRLQAGAKTAADGSHRLADGTVQLADAAARIAHGMEQVKSAVAQMQAKLPNDDQLKELATGSEAIAQGATQLKSGLQQLQAATPRLEQGATQLQAGGAKVPFVGKRLGDGAGQLHDGIVTYGDGVHRAGDGAAQLSDGIGRLNAAVQPLSIGLTQLNAGLATLARALPAADQLALFAQSSSQVRDGNAALNNGLKRIASGAEQLEAGAQQLDAGAHQLAAGLAEAADRFGAAFGSIAPDKLARPVDFDVNRIAPVAKNGPAFAPYFAALSLWVGAVMTSFVFHLRRLPDSLRSAPRAARWLAKSWPLLGVGLLQGTIVFALLRFGLNIPLTHPGALWVLTLLGSVTFVSTVLALISWLGDAGRLLSVILLILQLAASGGIYPIELSPPFYQVIHPYLPFTLLVRGFRAAMFSAFDAQWQPAALGLLLFAIGATLLGAMLARWKYVAHDTHGPAVDF
jgi:putative membrane protein